MHPILFEFGGLTIYTYGVLLAVAYLIGLQYALVRARARGLNPQRVMDLGIWIIVGALVGAKLFLIIIYPRQFLTSIDGLFNLARSAGVFYGGLIAAVAVALVYMRRYKLPLWTTTDCFAPGIALGHAIGRMGCLMAGCCYGRPADVPWAITFRNPEAQVNVGTPLNVPLHPTQIYEAVAELLILGILITTERRGRQFAGRTFWLYMLLYGISRFVIEFYRGDNRGAVLGVLSTSQVVSAILVPLAILMLVLLGTTVGPRDRAAAQRVAA